MISLLESGLFEYKNNLCVNLTLLDEKDFDKVFDSNIVYVYDDGNLHSTVSYFINKVIRDTIIDDRFIDIQGSFIKDSRDRRGCTRSQIESLKTILNNNYEFELNNLQLVFLCKQRRGLVQKLIDKFKNTEFIYWVPSQVTVKNCKAYKLV